MRHLKFDSYPNLIVSHFIFVIFGDSKLTLQAKKWEFYRKNYQNSIFHSK